MACKMRMRTFLKLTQSRQASRPDLAIIHIRMFCFFPFLLFFSFLRLYASFDPSDQLFRAESCPLTTVKLYDMINIMRW